MNLKENFPFIVNSEEHGQRADVVLSKRFPHISRSRWKALIQKEVLVLNGDVLENPSSPLKTGDNLDFDSLLAKDVFFEVDPARLLSDIPKFDGPEPKIVSENHQYIVIQKPVGLAVHPGAGLRLSQTLVCWALNQKKLNSVENMDSLMRWGEDVVEEFRPGIVHRLDQPTSGLLVMAKNPQAHASLAAQFSNHTARRLYYALVRGSLNSLDKKMPQRVSEFLLKRPCPIAMKRDESHVLSFAAYLRRDPVSRTQFQVSPTPKEGKKAISHFVEVGGDAKPYTWVECRLETGRTHQIRVSLYFLNLPIVGDPVYGDVPGRRLYLHAHQLEFDDPESSKRVSFKAPWPTEDVLDLPIPVPTKSFFGK